MMTKVATLRRRPLAQGTDFYLAVRLSAGMERLQSDLILVMLGKLAALDPHSLLRSTCTLAPLHRAAAENTEI